MFDTATNACLPPQTPTSTPPSGTGTRTPTVGTTPTATTTPPPTCAPRPNVGVSVVPSGVGRVQVTISAQCSAAVPSNSLQNLRVGAATGALVDAGGQVGTSGNFTVTLPAGTQQTTFFVWQVTPGAAATVPLVATDGCGAWPNFVGGGPSAFGAPARPGAIPRSER